MSSNEGYFGSWGRGIGGGSSTDPNSHTHLNKAVLDKLSESQSGNLLYNGSAILDPNSHTHANKELLDQLSDIGGVLYYNGVEIGSGGGGSSHEHDNLAILDQLGESGGLLTFNGVKVDTTGEEGVKFGENGVKFLEWQAGDQWSRISTALKAYRRIVLDEGIWEISNSISIDGSNPSDPYYISPATMPQLSGKGRTKTIIKCSGTGYHGIYILSQNNVHISDLKVQDALTDSGDVHGIRVIDSTNITISNVWVDNCRSGVRFATSSLSTFCNMNKLTNSMVTNCIGSNVEIIRADRTLISECTISQAGIYGIRINGTSDSIVTSNYLYNNTQQDISLQGYESSGGAGVTNPAIGNIISNNQLWDSRESTSWSVGIDMYNLAQNTVVSGNNISNKTIGISLRSNNNMGAFDNLITSNVITSCSASVTIMGNIRRTSVTNNRFKDWTTYASGSIDSQSSAVAVDGWEFANTPGRLGEIVIEGNHFINDTTTTARCVSVRRTSRPTYAKFNYYSLRIPSTTVFEKISGATAATLVTSFGTSDTNTNMGWVAVDTAYAG